VAQGRGWLRALAFLLLGAVGGAVTCAFRLGAKVDRLTLDNAILMDEVERLAGTLESRERALLEHVRTPVHTVEVEITGVSGEHARLFIEQQAHDLLKHLVGQEVSGISAPLIERALARTVSVDKQDYTLAPTLIVIGPKVFVRIAVREGRVEVSP